MKSIRAIIGVVAIVLGVFFIYWAYTHGPNTNLGDKISNAFAGEEALSETSYYLMMAAGVLMIISGGFRVFRATR